MYLGDRVAYLPSAGELGQFIVNDLQRSLLRFFRASLTTLFPLFSLIQSSALADPSVAKAALYAFDPSQENSYFHKARIIVDDPSVSRVRGDDRRSMSRLEAVLFSGVGVIEGRGFDGGTAALVGNCSTIVTAAHTIASESGLRTRDVAFLHQGDPSAAFLVDWTNSFFPPAAGFLGRRNIEYDIAVLALEQPVPNCVPLSYATLGNDNFDAYRNRVYSVAYHRDTGMDAVVHRNCNILNNEVDRDTYLRRGYRLDPHGYRDSVLLHDCDTGAGSSGSPLIVFSGETPYVIGINTGFPARVDQSNRHPTKEEDGFLPANLSKVYANHGILFTEARPSSRYWTGNSATRSLFDLRLSYCGIADTGPVIPRDERASRTDS